jgi:hypothetical protein
MWMVGAMVFFFKMLDVGLMMDKRLIFEESSYEAYQFFFNRFTIG